MSRVPILLLLTVPIMSVLGHAQSPAPSAAPANKQLPIDLSRIDTLNRNVVAADFNGDGIIDLAASDVPSPGSNISSTGSISAAAATAPLSTNNITLPAGNVSPPGTVAPGAATAAPAGPTVAVFGNSVSVPNASAQAGGGTSFAGSVPVTATGAISTATNASPGATTSPNVAVFGNPVTIPNGNAASPGLAARFLSATRPVVATGPASPASVAVFGNQVSTPNTFAAGTVVPGTNVAAGGTLAAPGGTVPAAVNTFVTPTNAASGVATVPSGTMPSGTTVTSAGNGNFTSPANTSVATANGTPTATTVPTGTVAAVGNAFAFGNRSVAGAAPTEPGAVVILLGNGNGTFKPPLRSWMSGDVLASGDFNGDKKTDLVIVTTDNQVLVLQGSGDGRFRAAFPVGASAPAQTETVQAGNTSTTSGSSTAAATTATVATTSSPTPAAANAGIAAASPAQAGGTGSAAAQTGLLLPDTVTFALVEDLDADGKLDLVVGANPRSARVFRGMGDFTFAPPVELVTGQLPNDGLVADINGDGKKDIIVANRAGQGLSIFLNQGGVLFTVSDMPLDRPVNDVAAADVNRDSKLDLVAAIAASNGETQFTDGFAYVLLGRGDGTFAQPAQYPVSPGTWQIVVADLTGDGILDIATANRSALALQAGTAATNNASDTVSILAGKGDGTFGTELSFLLEAQGNAVNNRFRGSVRSLTASDLNNDQAPDLIVSGGAILMSRSAVRSTTAAPAAARF